jgi:hypothetical protein
MTDEDTQHDPDEAREAQGVPAEGPGSKTSPPSNPEPDSGEAGKGQEKLDRIVNW